MDAGIYFPYADQEVVTFDATFVEDLYDELTSQLFYRTDKKYNHRYPNRGYVTISKTYGRRVCPEGYPFVASIPDLCKFKYIMFKFGIKEKFITCYVPVNVNIDKKKPFANLKLRVKYSEPTIPSFSLSTEEKGFRKNVVRTSLYILASAVREYPEYENPTVLVPDKDFASNQTENSRIIKYQNEVQLNGMSW